MLAQILRGQKASALKSGELRWRTAGALCPHMLPYSPAAAAVRPKLRTKLQNGSH
jgi:hypothetical protein